MRYFPQLETNTAGQYPLRRKCAELVVSVDSLDGRRFSYFDGAASQVEWELHYQGLTENEREAVSALFAACEGRLLPFVLLDPAANLLRWSEDYSNAAWTVGPLLSLSGGVTDPWSTTRASTISNSGAATAAVAQTIGAPGALQYCLSAWVKGSGSLRIDSGGVVVEKDFATGAAWERVHVSTKPNSAAETVTFSLRVAPAAAASVVGMQAEAQIAPGGYKKTTSRSGVYPNARFARDEMAWTMQGPNNNAAVIRIISRSN